ncbi:MAG: hypothetical protein IT433_08765 [Phycisphaerales bacterium]|nr:hypothetical protein [Phycisphaerales bacterium]
MKDRHGVRIGLGLAAMVLGVLAGAPEEASAQQTMSVRATSPMGGRGGGQVTKRSMERYADLLGLDQTQRETALAIHEGYSATCEQARKSQRDAMDELRRSEEDSGDHGVFMEKLPAIQKKSRETTQAAEKSLFSDLKSLLTSEQEAGWTRVERMRRRETGLRGGLSGESLDIADVVHAMKLPAEPAQLVAPMVEDYESAMDSHLRAKEAAQSEATAFEPGKPMDVEAMQKQMESSRQMGEKIVQLNATTAEKIKAALPEELQQKFADEVRRRSFPTVYKESRVAKDLDAALAMSDLDESQRERLKEIKAAYARDLGPVNNRWADAIRESEQSGQEGGMALGGGGFISMRMGEEPEGLREARKARREMDEKARERLKSVLRPEQQEKLSKAAPGGDGEMGDGEPRMMFVVEERADAPPPK